MHPLQGKSFSDPAIKLSSLAKGKLTPKRSNATIIIDYKCESKSINYCIKLVVNFNQAGVLLLEIEIKNVLQCMTILKILLAI